MRDSTSFFCEVCEEEFNTYDSCVYDGLIIKCKCGVEFKIALIKVKEKDIPSPVLGGSRKRKEYEWA